MIFQTVQILVSLLAHFALVWFLLLHTLCAGVGCLSIGIHNRECAVTILVQSLVVVTVLKAVSRGSLLNPQQDLPIYGTLTHSGSCMPSHILSQDT